MSNDELFTIIVEFRTAIVEAKEAGELEQFGVMRYFPRGCCEFASDLLAYYLYDKFSIVTEHYNGKFDDGIFEHTTNHEWLTYDNNIIDITYSQLCFVTHSKAEIYFGVYNEFYNSLEDKHLCDYCDIRQVDWLFSVYKVICRHLH